MYFLFLALPSGAPYGVVLQREVLNWFDLTVSYLSLMLETYKWHRKCVSWQQNHGMLISLCSGSIQIISQTNPFCISWILDFIPSQLFLFHFEMHKKCNYLTDLNFIWGLSLLCFYCLIPRWYRIKSCCSISASVQGSIFLHCSILSQVRTIFLFVVNIGSCWQL